jgi:L-asparaginase II
MTAAANPVLVEITRGPMVESRHRGVIAVVDAEGEPVLAIGDVAPLVYPRSAVKALQALPLVETGAAAAFGLSDAELALACSSHNAEPMHVEAARRMLAKAGLEETALECGAHWPRREADRTMVARAAGRPSPIHNNCSGKHAGMLTLARHLGAPLAGYSQPDHPVQRRIAAVLAEMTGASLPSPAVDGCGVPTYPLSLVELARGMARLADPGGLPPARGAACTQVRAAIAAHPHLVAGTGRPCTEIMTLAPHVLVKSGAEGVYVAALPERGLGLALKVEDGASRAAPVALLALLGKLGAFDPATLADHARPKLRNHAGRVVGRIEPAAGWLTKGS